MSALTSVPTVRGEAHGGDGHTYAEFLARKTRVAPTLGRPCVTNDVHPYLHPWQREAVAWAVTKGRAALWWDTGLGKTLAQLEWARLSGDRSLVVAPLAVCQQTIREARKIGLDATYRREDDGASGITVTNYEMADRFDPAHLDAVVLDEASILKQATGATATRLIAHFAPVRARLAATATPAPNDMEELTNQAAFLGVMSRAEMLAAYFVHDQDGWRLKGHARRPMFRWMSTWAMALRKPSDIGGDDTGYDLPGLRIVPEVVPVEVERDGELFPSLGGVGGRARMRRETLAARCQRAAALVRAEPDEPWLLWCGLNDEADELARLIPGAVNVHGGWSAQDKADAYLAFADGEIRCLVTKMEMAALGLNFQHCARMAFVGMKDSFEGYYQAIRRCHRYGQTREVHAHVVVADAEAPIVANVARKEAEASAAMAELVADMTAARSAA